MNINMEWADARLCPREDERAGAVLLVPALDVRSSRVEGESRSMDRDSKVSETRPYFKPTNLYAVIFCDSRNT